LTLIGPPGTIPVLSITVPSRRVPLSVIRDAANSIYGPAVGAPPVRLDGPGQPTTDLYCKLEFPQPIGSCELRGAYSVVRHPSPTDAALSGGAGTRKVVAVVTGGNIDLPRFASLIGACSKSVAGPGLQ